ncbi:unnamed protein product [Ixodes pacificus]
MIMREVLRDLNIERKNWNILWITFTYYHAILCFPTLFYLQHLSVSKRLHFGFKVRNPAFLIISDPSQGITFKAAPAVKPLSDNLTVFKSSHYITPKTWNSLGIHIRD